MADETSASDQATITNLGLVIPFNWRRIDSELRLVSIANLLLTTQAVGVVMEGNHYPLDATGFKLV
jgi:hypothetical protein